MVSLNYLVDIVKLQAMLQDKDVPVLPGQVEGSFRATEAGKKAGEYLDGGDGGVSKVTTDGCRGDSWSTTGKTRRRLCPTSRAATIVVGRAMEMVCPA